jgi:hypothetical protein
VVIIEAACGRTAAENLPSCDAIAASALVALPVPAPVCPAGRHEHQILRDDALQQPVDRRFLIPPAPAAVATMCVCIDNASAVELQ